MNYSIVKSSGWYIVSKIMVVFLSVIAIPIYTRLMVPEEFGNVALYITWIGLLTPFLGLGVHLSISKAKSTFSDVGCYLVNMLFLVTVTSIIISIIISFFNYKYEILFGIDGWFELVLYVNVYLSICVSMCFSYLQFEYKYKQLSILSVIKGGGVVFLSVVLIYMVSKWGYELRVFSIFLFDFLFFVFLFKNLIKKIPMPKIKLNYILFSLRYSYPLILSSLCYIVNAQIDRLFLSHYVGSSETGIYSLTYTIGSLILMIAIAVKQAINPWLYKKLDEGGGRGEISFVLENYVAFFTFASVGFLLISKEVLKILSDFSYWGGVDYIGFIVFSTYIQVLILNESETQMYLKKTGINSLIMFLGSLLNVFLNYFLVVDYGGKGAAVATFFTYFIMLIILILINCKLIKLKVICNSVYGLYGVYFLFFFLVVSFLDSSFFVFAFIMNFLFFLRRFYKYHYLIVGDKC